ncbi:BrnA antitoxin family protein [Patescibacteria group bacterium]|nr:BrnA antitoxin family protein [Patescibacteria group bacterium]MBU1200069.1 BrnA antitoxin family protein [Patescibacteria group bacterium]MBU1256433.1 BrnA antitoxin family protein [Patescibacteria group bacterium]MBU1457093.1 BrnA antitoxin family protein [Patescibacteria group bacterium]
MKKQIKVPKFKNENQERLFWSKIDLSEYLDPKDFVRVSFPNLKPSSRPISIRLPDYLLDRVKEKANEISVPYQSLIKQYIQKGVFSSI